MIRTIFNGFRERSWFSKSNSRDNHRFALHIGNNSYYMRCLSRDELEQWIHFLGMVCQPSHLHWTRVEKAMAEILSMLHYSKNSPPYRSHPSFEQQDVSLADRNFSYPIVELHQHLASNSILCHQTVPIQTSLTTMASHRLELESVRLFKGILIFANTPMLLTSMEYHIALAQSLLRKCLAEADLQNEFILQLVKQATFVEHQTLATSPLSPHEHSSTRKIVFEAPHLFKRLPALLQTWQLLAISLAVLLPTRLNYPYLRINLFHSIAYFHGHPISIYARYCLNLIEHRHQASLKCGLYRSRMKVPSTPESLAILSVILLLLLIRVAPYPSERFFIHRSS